MNGACAALTDPTAKFCADQFKTIAKDPKERCVGCDVYAPRLPVNVQGEFTHGKSAIENLAIGSGGPWGSQDAAVKFRVNRLTRIDSKSCGGARRILRCFAG